MTNHPRRKRPDVTSDAERDQAAAEALAGDLLPAEPGDIPPQGSAGVPAHTDNGVPPGLRPNAAKLIGQAVGAALGETLPQMLAQAFAEALRRQYYCSTCFVERLNWETAHEADLKAAVEQMQIAAQAFPPGDPRLAQLSPFMFLPPHLLPSLDPASPHPEAIPDPAAGVVMIGGTLYCPRHAPGVNRPDEVAKRPFYVAQASLSPAMIAEIVGQRPAA